MPGKKEANAKPRRAGKKQRSGMAIAAAVGGGVLGGGGAVLALENFTEIDNRVISGVGTGVGIAAAIAGAMTKSPNVRDVGLGLAAASGALLAKNVIDGASDGGDERNAGGGDTQKTLEAIKEELQKANAAKPKQEQHPQPGHYPHPL